MNINTLRLLRCPYCRGRLTLQTVWEKSDQQIRRGVVSCSCDHYPIIESILILIKPVNREILPLATSGNYARACNKLFSLRPLYNQLFRLAYPLSPISKACELLFGRSLFAFIGLRWVLFPLTLFPDSRSWARYLSKIEYAPEMQLPIRLVSQKLGGTSTIVDVGCGITPYASSVLFSGKKRSLIGLDKNFLLLYISTIFFPNKHQSMVCADLTHGFPLARKAADCMFSLNAFTYLYNQRSTLSSMIAATRRRGLVCLGDLHTSLNPERLYWYPSPPYFYTKNLVGNFKIFDYEKTLQSLKSGSMFSIYDPPSKAPTKSRYGICVYVGE